MPRGPAPRSAADNAARGNPGKRPTLAAAAAIIPTGEVKPPAKMRQSARHVWNTLAPELFRLNVLRATDANALARYCDDVVDYREASEKLRSEGQVYKVESNHGSYHRMSPWVAIKDRIVARLIAMEDRFGLSPQARQSIMIRAAAIATQGSLPFGEPDPSGPSSPTVPVPDDNPIGFLGAPTRH